MDDRELLEYAARAAGMTVKGFWINNSEQFGGLTISPRNGLPRFHWNPLTDDGDALRLAVKLGIYVKHFPSLEDEAMEYPGFVEAWRIDETDPICTEYMNQRTPDEKLEATRSVIVRAAAEIGKAM